VKIALLAAEAGLDKKASAIEIVDVCGKVDYADFLVLMTGSSDRHVASIADNVEAMLGKALAGIDSALLQAVEANRKALAQFVEHGAGLQEKQLKEAIANIEKMEDVFFAAVAKATQAAGPMQAPWEHALSAMKIKGTETGTQATAAVEQLMAQAQTA